MKKEKTGKRKWKNTPAHAANMYSRSQTTVPFHSGYYRQSQCDRTHTAYAFTKQAKDGAKDDEKNIKLN